MALFGKKTKGIEEKKMAVARVKDIVSNKVFNDVILNPRVTEKSHGMTEGLNVYVFNVKSDATKGSVKNAIRDLFKVSPTKVAVVPIPRKTTFVRGKVGMSGGGRKAYVYLKKGDKLEIA